MSSPNVSVPSMTIVQPYHSTTTRANWEGVGKGEGSREGGRERLRIGHRDWASGGGSGLGIRIGHRYRGRDGHRDKASGLGVGIGWGSGWGSGLGIGIGVGMGVGMGWGSDHLGDGGDAAHEDPKGCGLALPDMVSFRGASLVPV